MEENRFLLLWEITVVCVSNLVLRGIVLGPRTCFSPPQSRRGRLMWFSRSCTFESVGVPKEYCEPRKSWTEFVVLVEGKSEPLISSIRLCQAPCLVLQTRRVKVKRDSNARFNRCLPTSDSLPDWIPLARKTQKHVHCRWQRSWRRISSWPSRRVNQVQENAVLQLRNRQIYVVDCDRELSLLNVDDLSNVNETRIKVLSSYPSGHVEVRCSVDKKSYQLSKKLLWCRG